MVAILGRQLTYLKFTLVPYLTRPLNLLLAVVLLATVYVLWRQSQAKEGAMVLSGLDVNAQDYMEDRVPMQIEWAKYVKKWQPVELVPFDIKLAHKEKCPACYGTDMCENIEKGQLLVDLKGTPSNMQKKGLYFGRWEKEDIVIKSLVDEQTFKYFDEYMCKNITGMPSCDIAKAIVDPKSFVTNDAMLNPLNFANYHKIAHRKLPKIPTMHCASKDLVKSLSSVFDQDQDGKLEPNEKAMFFSSFALNTEATIYRGARKMMFGFETAQEAFHGPKFFGACGRVVVLRNGGIPVTELLDAPWEVRVDLAVSILGLVGQLEASDLRWYFVYGGFQLQNFVVDDAGFVSIVDAKEIGLVDLDEHPPPLPDKLSDEGAKSLCNADCFASFIKKLEDPAAKQADRPCDLMAYRGGQMMNALVCQMLSDLPEHREEGRRFKGLLHDPPKDGVDQLNTHLRECVTETDLGGRDESVNSLYAIFDEYLEMRVQEPNN